MSTYITEHKNTFNRSLHRRDAEGQLRAKVHLALDERRNEASGEAHNLRLVLRDSELEVLNELNQDRLHLDDPE